MTCVGIVISIKNFDKNVRAGDREEAIELMKLRQPLIKQRGQLQGICVLHRVCVEGSDRSSCDLQHERQESSVVGN